MCWSLHQLISQIIIYEFFIQCLLLRSLFLENNIQTFIAIDSVQKLNNDYTFQLKPLQQKLILLLVFPRKSYS